MRPHEWLFAKAARNETPLSGTFELLPRCNMVCKMCYVRLTSEEQAKIGIEKTAEEWLDMAKQCKKAGMLFLLLTGGEPFLYKDFPYLYMELKKMGFLISINTNGTLLNDECLEWLIQHPPYRVNITLYGASGETYEALCGYRAGYEKVLHAVRTLHNAGVYVKLNASITPYNGDDLEDIFAIAKELDVPLQAGSYMFPPVRKSENNIGRGDRFSAEETGIYQARIDYLRMYEEEFCQRARQMMEDGIWEHETGEEECASLDKNYFTCRAGRSSFWITWDGRMTACGMLNQPEARPFEQGFSAAWKQIVDTVKYMTAMEQCAGCGYRKMCRICPGMTYTETGDFHKKPEYICRIVKARIQETERIYEEIMKVRRHEDKVE